MQTGTATARTPRRMAPTLRTCSTLGSTRRQAVKRAESEYTTDLPGKTMNLRLHSDGGWRTAAIATEQSKLKVVRRVHIGIQAMQ